LLKYRPGGQLQLGIFSTGFGLHLWKIWGFKDAAK
jgi:hypothetical protein